MTHGYGYGYGYQDTSWWQGEEGWIPDWVPFIGTRKAAVDTARTGVDVYRAGYDTATAALETARQQAQQGFDAAQDYLTTATSGTLASLAIAAQTQINALAAGRSLVSLAAETHGVMLDRPDKADESGAAAYYRLAYWLAVAGRINLGKGDVEAAQALGEAAQVQIKRAGRKAPAAFASGLPLIPGRGGLAGAGRATIAGLWLLWRTGRPEVREIVANVNARAIRTVVIRLSLVVGGTVVVAGLAGYGLSRRGRLRRNGRLSKAQRDRRRRGYAMLAAGLALMSPLDEGIIAALTAGLGIPVLPVQGGATLVGGAILSSVGAYTALTAKRAGR